MNIRKNFWEGIGVFLIFLFLVAGVAYGASEIPALQAAKDPAEKARVQDLINKAKKEGKLVITAVMVEPKHARYTLEGFKEYYGLKNLKDEFTYGQTGQIVGRVEQLIKAGRPTHDIVWMPAWAWFTSLMKRGLLTQYESPYYKEYTISNAAGNSRPGYWVSDSYTFHPMWNAGALAKAGFKDFNPQSWWDFVDPKLAKLTSMISIIKSTSATAVFMGVRKVVGDDWFKKLSAMHPAIYNKTAQGRDWCASGEYPIQLGSHAKNAMTAKKTGADIRLSYPKEGVTLLPFAPVIMKGGEHQAAAKLFIDYIRSAPGADRLAASGAALLFGRPGVKMPPNPYLPPAETIKAIPMNWDKEDTPGSVNAFHDFLKGIGFTY
jgi:iron(III) transport system substrate-binding protein